MRAGRDLTRNLAANLRAIHQPSQILRDACFAPTIVIEGIEPKESRATGAGFGRGWMFDGRARHRSTVPAFETVQRPAAEMSAQSAVMRQPSISPMAAGVVVVIGRSEGLDRLGDGVPVPVPVARAKAGDQR